MEKQDAVVRRIEILGEAADRLMKSDAAYATNFPDLPLRDIKDMRNMVVHGYDAVDAEIIWNTAKSDIPVLRKCLEELIGSNPIPHPWGRPAACPRTVYDQLGPRPQLWRDP